MGLRDQQAHKDHQVSKSSKHMCGGKFFINSIHHFPFHTLIVQADMDHLDLTVN